MWIIDSALRTLFRSGSAASAMAFFFSPFENLYFDEISLAVRATIRSFNAVTLSLLGAKYVDWTLNSGDNTDSIEEPKWLTSGFGIANLMHCSNLAVQELRISGI